MARSNAIWRIGFFSIFITFLSACGGSGGGDGGSKGSSSRQPSLQNVKFSEDTTLNQNLSGVWIATTHTQTSNPSEQVTTSSERDVRETIYIIDDPTLGLVIRNCRTGVENLVAGSNSLTFRLYENSYFLNIDSNTHLSGPVESIYGATGNATLIKVMAAPSLTDLSFGTLRYSFNDGREVTLNIQCYNEEHLVAKYRSTSESYSHFSSTYEISDFFQNAVSFTTDSYDDEDDVSRLVAFDQNGQHDEFSNDSSNESVKYSVSGSNGVKVSFEATDDNHFVNGAEKSVTVAGSATLNF